MDKASLSRIPDKDATWFLAGSLHFSRGSPFDRLF